MRSDVDLRDAVLDAIGYDHRVAAGSVGVSVKKGQVTLTGVLGSSDARVAAEMAAQGVAGVQGVSCEVTLRLTDIDVIAPN